MLPFFISDEMGFSDEELLLFAAASGKAVEDTATGNPLTFITDVSKPLKSLLIPFTPQQEGSGDPSPQNIRSILPWNGLKVWNGGKNLFDASAVIRRDGYILNEQGQETTSNVSGYTQNITPVKPSTKYTFSGIVSYDGYLWRIYFYDKSGLFVSRTDSIDGFTVGNTFTFTTPSNCYGIAFQYTREFVQFSTFMVEAGQTATAYEPYKPITETDISFPSPVYGGTLDVVSGVLTVTHKCISLNDSSKWSKPTANIVYTEYFNDRKQEYRWGDKCTCFPSESKASGTPYIGWAELTQNRYAIFINGSDLTLEDVQALAEANKIFVCYELAVPQSVQLTGEQITALVGDNTIWSDADGSMTAVYLKKG